MSRSNVGADRFWVKVNQLGQSAVTTWLCSIHYRSSQGMSHIERQKPSDKMSLAKARVLFNPTGQT